jgi:hypothetical protein
VDKCVTCQFYDRKSAASDGRSQQWGQCRRTAPLLAPGASKSYMIEGVWPTVRDDDWCGEWKSHGLARRIGEPLGPKATGVPTLPRVAPMSPVAAVSTIGAPLGGADPLAGDD